MGADTIPLSRSAGERGLLGSDGVHGEVLSVVDVVDGVGEATVEGRGEASF